MKHVSDILDVDLNPDSLDLWTTHASNSGTKQNYYNTHRHTFQPGAHIKYYLDHIQQFKLRFIVMADLTTPTGSLQTRLTVKYMSSEYITLPRARS